jgi:hypothetical protein
MSPSRSKMSTVQAAAGRSTEGNLAAALKI